MTLTFPRTLQSQGHRGHVNLFGKVAASQSSEESRWKWANGGEEAGRGEFCVSVFYQEKGGFKEEGVFNVAFLLKKYKSLKW